jgi:hypothetical protein
MTDVVQDELFPQYGEVMAHARATDPVTSHEAAASIGGDNIRASQQAILDLLRRKPGTDNDIAYRYGAWNEPQQSASGLRTRRSELVTKGLVEDSGERVVLPSGRKSIVWRAVTT